MSPRLVVVGGGLAGLSAALTVADAGWDVTVLEARPRLGGATHSFRRDGLDIDNGQHVFLRCCTAYRGFLRRLGVEALTTLQPRLDIPVLTADGWAGRLRRDRLPAPLHLGRALLGYRLLTPVERVRAARAVLALGRLDPADPAVDARSFGAWLTDRGQSPAAVRALWELVTVATLNRPAGDASLALAATVFRTGLLDGADNGDIGYARVPLQQLHGNAAARALAAAGADVRLRAKVTGLARRTDGGWAVELDDDALEADAVLLAVPPAAADRLLPAGAHPLAGRFAELGSSPIVNVHVVYDRQVTDAPFVAGVGTDAQWVFDRTAAGGCARGQYLAVSVSAADDWIDRPTAEIRAAFLPQLAALFPAARRAEVTTFLVTREREATFRQAPGSGALRPGPRAEPAGLYLAGAWTDTGWPATMEGAVRSGCTAATAVLEDLTGPHPDRARTVEVAA